MFYSNGQLVGRGTVLHSRLEGLERLVRICGVGELEPALEASSVKRHN